MSSKLVDLDGDKVEKAVAALRQLSSKSKKNNELLDKVVDVELQICLKKIPREEKTLKVKLPHSIKKPDVEVCLFVKDLNRKSREYEATVRHYQDIFKKKGVTSVTEIIPLKSLKTEYKPYEAKRNLSNAYDTFLADARIIRLLPPYLGKHFYGRKKSPIQVNLQAKDLAAEMEAAVSNSRCFISNKGSSSTAIVAHLQMEDKEITENIIASVSQLSQKVAGGPVNIRLLSVKLKDATSIPVYISTGGPQDVTMPTKKAPEPVEAEEISTIFGAKVKVFPNGSIKVIKDEDSEQSNKAVSKGRLGKRKREPVKHRPEKRVIQGKSKS